MTIKSRRSCLAANFKRSLQPPLIGTYEMISWASANMMFDIGGDDGDIVMGRRELRSFIGTGENQRN